MIMRQKKGGITTVFLFPFSCFSRERKFYHMEFCEKKVEKNRERGRTEPKLFSSLSPHITTLSE